jgi:hypothetical protein
MDIQARINELTQQQQALLQRTQEDGVNIQRLAGAIAILNEQLNEEVNIPFDDGLIDTSNPEPNPKQASPNGKVKEEVKA